MNKRNGCILCQKPMCYHLFIFLIWTLMMTVSMRKLVLVMLGTSPIIIKTNIILILLLEEMRPGNSHLKRGSEYSLQFLVDGVLLKSHLYKIGWVKILF